METVSIDAPSGISGGTGTVFASDGNLVCKRMPVRADFSSVKVLAEVITGFLVDERSKFLCPCLGATESAAGVVTAVMPRLGCDLVQLINHSPQMRLAPPVVEKILKDCASSLLELQSVLGPGCSHGDIKLDNVMVSRRDAAGDVCAALIDYGHCKARKFRSRRKRLGYWDPPEDTEEGVASDMWSLGMLCLVAISPRCRAWLRQHPGPRGAMALVAHLCGAWPSAEDLSFSSLGPFRRRKLERAIFRASGLYKSRQGEVRRAVREYKSLVDPSVVLADQINRCLSWSAASRPSPRELLESLSGSFPLSAVPEALRERVTRPAALQGGLSDYADDGGFQSPILRSTRRALRRAYNVALCAEAEALVSPAQVGEWISLLCRLGRQEVRERLEAG